ncbi:MAG: hypothetical protein O3A84_07340 [Proteobacteria bacterium]|nr:hypothetical protein [Pseudomonadota bacterium]
MTVNPYIDISPPEVRLPPVDRGPASIRNAILRVVAGILLGIIAFAVIIAFSGPVSAQQAAGDRTTLVKQLTQRFAEHPVSIGLTSSGGMIEIFASKDGSTWTMLLTMPDGQSRVIGDGESWFTVPEKLSGTKISSAARAGDH